MQIFALWNGGSSYGGGEFPGDLEMFNSVDDAIVACRERMESGHWKPQDFDFLNKDTVSVLCPCVDESSNMHVYLADPTDSTDPYPDFVIEWDENAEMFDVTPA